MILGGCSLFDLSLDDFRTLVENRVPEDPHLEYKQTAYSGRADDIREMLRDISALANAEGGYLVMGIEEDIAGRAIGISLIDEPLKRIQAINQACLDGIEERIPGLEVKAYEAGFNQGIIVIRVPPSDQRPHMVVREHRTDFFCRYGTDKRPMTIGEIRQIILTNPFYRRMVELEILTQRRPATVVQEAEISGPPYVQILTERSVERFLQQYLISAIRPQALVIVSPFIGDLAGHLYDLKDILNKVAADQTRMYVITRPPRDKYHRAGLALLQQSPLVEIRYNHDVHAKLYICWSRAEEESFAMFGSGNLTSAGLRHNLELGMIIFAHGYGRQLVNALYQWSSVTLRSKSERIKAIEIIKEKEK
jgi:hypothetical protein